MSNYKSLKSRDIVIVGQQPWDTSIGSNCKNIALEWSKNNRVLYVNAPLDRITSYRHSEDLEIKKRLSIIKGKQTGIELIKENLWNLFPEKMIESVNWISNQTIFEYFNKRNNRIFSECILNAINELDFNNFILFNDNDIFRSYHLKSFLKPAISIYYSRDFMLAVDYWKKHGTKMEPELIANSDICVANSTYLTNYCKQYNPNSFYIGQGCELDLFLHANDLPIPEDMLALNFPVIGYVGALQSIRLDIKILEHIAKDKPEWNLVLVGPEDDEFKKSELHQFKNVHFLGAKKAIELPAYINAFDVCINPQLINQVTIGNYPRKIDEYLAVGKPVVATQTEAMLIFKNFVQLAENKTEYIDFIADCLSNENDAIQLERKAFAANHTWENSVMEINQAISFWESKKA